jgi:hypothetical protein
MKARGVRAGRLGFTLVELLVAFALVIFIMAVIAQAFSAAGKVVSDLKVAGEMEEKLRAVMVLLKRDLAANHFDEGQAGSQRKLSDANFWDSHLGSPLSPTPPTPQGFFRIYQVGRPTVWMAGLEVPATTFAGSSLHFAVYRQPDYPGNMFRTLALDPALLTAGTDAQREERFQSIAPTNTYFSSPWGEVAWWMEPVSQPATTVSDEGLVGQPLYVLRRRERAMWPMPGVNPGNISNLAAIPEVSHPEIDPSAGVSTRYNDPVRVTIPAFRFGMTRVSAADVNAGAAYPANTSILAGVSDNPSLPYPVNDTRDIVLSGVLSFDVSVLLEGDTEFRDLSHPNVQQFSNGNPVFPLATGPWCFDTWTNREIGSFSYSGNRWSDPNTAASVPLYRRVAVPGPIPQYEYIRIRAIQVTLRIWNQKDGPNGKAAGSARQMTLIQEM